MRAVDLRRAQRILPKLSQRAPLAAVVWSLYVISKLKLASAKLISE
jgi:hypothetical protein